MNDLTITMIVVFASSAFGPDLISSGTCERITVCHDYVSSLLREAVVFLHVPNSSIAAEHDLLVSVTIANGCLHITMSIVMSNINAESDVLSVVHFAYPQWICTEGAILV